MRKAQKCAISVTLGRRLKELSFKNEKVVVVWPVIISLYIAKAFAKAFLGSI